MSTPGGGTGLHGLLQEATGCAMDTERDWVAQLEAHSYTVQAVPLGEAVTEEIQTLAQKSNKCSWGVVLFAQDRGEPAWVVLSAGGYARSTADWPGTKWHWRKKKILDRLADFHRFRDVRRAYTFRSLRKKQRSAPKPKVSAPSIPQYKEWRFRVRNGELVPNFTEADAVNDFEALLELESRVLTSPWSCHHGSPIPDPICLLPLVRIGQKFADWFHWNHRFHTRKGPPASKMSVWNALSHLQNDDPRWTSTVSNLASRKGKSIQQCSAFEIDQLWSETLRRETAAFSVTQFSSHAAKAIATCLQSKSVLDFSGGWGDRLSGLLASPCVQHITLIEPRAKACVAFQKQVATVASFVKKEVTILNGCAEILMPTLHSDSFDLIHTSPPYYNTELYEEDGHPQAWRKFGTLDQFRSGFLRVVLSESCRVLKPGGVLALNIDNSQRAQGLCESLIEIAGGIRDLRFCGTIGLQKGAGVGCEPIYLWTKCGDVAQIRNAFLPQPVSLPAPVLKMYDGVAVVRDDLVDGGTKLRGALAYIQHHDVESFVYASPREGAAQIAIAKACQILGKECTIFVPDAPAAGLHHLSMEAEKMGANIEHPTIGGFSALQALARSFAEQHGAHVIPFGFDDEIVINAIAQAARLISFKPSEVWSVVSSGVLQRGLQRAWPDANFFGVQIGHQPTAEQLGGAKTLCNGEELRAAEGFARPCPERLRPPFPSNLNYDAKAWRFVRKHGNKDVLFWNVAA